MSKSQYDKAFEKTVNAMTVDELKDSSGINYHLGLIVKHYGIEAQIDKAIEELNELREVLEGIKQGGTDIEHLAEEIVDVNLMLKQLRIMFHIPVNILEELRNYKVTRTLWRIERESVDGEPPNKSD